MRNLITSALPYANGPIHFGHIAGVYLPADIYSRHKKLLGEKTIHISGSDEHGVAIMQNANKAGISYQEYVDQWNKDHLNLFNKYDINFDFFGQTSAKYHQEEVIKWFDILYSKGLIEKKAEEQLQCQSCHNYLPDRYVEGTCYVCGYEEARGDECPSCGTWIDPVKLIKPECKFCGSHDIEVKSVDQWYLMLSKFHKEFRQWFEGEKDDWRKTVSSFVDSLSKEGMVDRAITRDLDWGIDVPLEEALGKKLYVWFDAPIGYVSNTKQYCETSGEDYMKDWWCSSDTKVTNFIGKDNIIFHGIIFPVMSLASERAHAVNNLAANQYVNLEGKQFSKSKGWYIDAHEAIDEFGSDALRYYLTTLIPENTDSSYTWDGFEAKINNELANNIGNFVNRCLTFFFKNWKEGISADMIAPFFETDFFTKLIDSINVYHSHLNETQIKKGLEHLMSIGQDANGYFSDHEPWAVMKTDKDKASEIIGSASVYALCLGVLFEPYLPQLSAAILSHFPEMSDEIKAKIYAGEAQGIKEFFSQNIVIQKKPKGLVPKLDKDRIEELKTKLESL